MANWQVISLDTTTPQLRAPGTGDGYSFNSGSTQLGVWTTTGLGVGTASPAYKLDVAGTINSSASSPTGYNLVFRTSGITTGRAQTGLTNTSGDLYTGIEGSTAGQTLSGSAAYSAFVGTFTANPLYLVTNGSIRTTLDSSGNLGIGTVSPATKLHVAAGNVTIDNTYGYLGADSAGTRESMLSISAGNNVTVAAPTLSGSLQYAVRNASGSHQFFIGGTERARITSAGELVVGTTAAAGSSQVTAYGATNGQIAVQNSTNWSRLLQNSGDLYIDNGVGGSAGNIIFRNSSSTVERARITSTGNVVVNTAAVATTATDGFLYIPTCAGAPTGVPTTFTGRSPLVVDSTNNRFYVYVNGAWKYATLT